MREQRQIVERWRNGEGLVLATLVRVQGSSYRRPGARMLICKDGSYAGGISAGCLEADLLRKARWMVRSGAVVERYSTIFDETAEMPFGLGCGGVIDVLLESCESAECCALLGAMKETSEGREHSVATWLPQNDRPLMRAVFNDSGGLAFSSPGLSSESIISARFACLQRDDEQSEELLLDRLIPPQRLFIFGAGDDVKPLATMAGLLGWKVIVADGRSHLARRERFPDSNVRIISDLQTAFNDVMRQDAAVIMTHSFEQDGECLAALLSAQPRYLGLLGARVRSSLLIAGAASSLGLNIAECCERVCAPVGLNIGGEGPEAIALAIMAEAQACCAGKKTGSRRLTPRTVQRQLMDADLQAYAQTQCALNVA